MTEDSKDQESEDVRRRVVQSMARALDAKFKAFKMRKAEVENLSEKDKDKGMKKLLDIADELDEIAVSLRAHAGEDQDALRLVSEVERALERFESEVRTYLAGNTH